MTNAGKSTGTSSRHPTRDEPANAQWIKSVSVDRLFGQHTFSDIRLYDVEREYPQLSFLYGENGVGKSTILRIIFSLFHDSDGPGYKSYISKLPFRSFCVEFVDGQRVELQRKDGELSGDITFVLDGPRADTTFIFRVDEDGDITETLNPKSDAHIDQIAALALPIVYVNDRRTVRSTRAEWDVRHQVARRGRTSLALSQYDSSSYDEERDPSTQGLELLLENAQRTFANRAVEAAAIASVDMDNIYLSIAESIASPITHPTRRTSHKSLLDRIESIKSYLNEFGSFSLVNAPNLDRIFDLLRQQKAAPRDQLISVIEPYVAAIEKRVEASRALTERIFSFETNVNKFLHRKRLVTSVNSNMRVMVGSAEIPIDALSSGEKHLLYLFAVSTLSHENPILIMVDEPELSLNQVWQKTLISALLDVSAQSAQYIMASHSFEIISKFKSSAVRLKYG